MSHPSNPKDGGTPIGRGGHPQSNPKAEFLGGFWQAFSGEGLANPLRETRT